jgi:hypothetical protein
MKGSGGYSLNMRKGRSGSTFMPIIKKKKGGSILLGSQSSIYQPDISASLNPESKKFYQGKGLKTDMQKITEKLDKLNMIKPKNVRKNIRVSL